MTYMRPHFFFLKAMAKTITVKAMVLLPNLPNFLRYEGGTIPIADLADEELRALGATWTEELVKLAQSRRPPV